MTALSLNHSLKANSGALYKKM